MWELNWYGPDKELQPTIVSSGFQHGKPLLSHLRQVRQRIRKTPHLRVQKVQQKLPRPRSLSQQGRGQLHAQRHLRRESRGQDHTLWPQKIREIHSFRRSVVLFGNENQPRPQRFRFSQTVHKNLINVHFHQVAGALGRRNRPVRPHSHLLSLLRL